MQEQVAFEARRQGEDRIWQPLELQANPDRCLELQEGRHPRPHRGAHRAPAAVVS